MKKLDFILENVDPLLFSERGADNILFTTRRYVPGSAVRGALAHLYIAKHNLQNAYEDETFYQLFLSGKVRFLPAYPLGCRELKNGAAMVMPLSLKRSKDKTVTVDLTACEELRAGFKNLKGFAVKEADKLYKIDTNVKIELHMSRSGAKERITGSSRDGNVFNYEYLEAGQLFKGSFAADADVEALLQKVLAELDVKELYLGRSKGAQYGKCLYVPLKQQQNTESAAVGAGVYLLAQTPYIAFGSWQRVETAASELLGELEQRLGIGIAKQNLKIFAAVENIDGYMGVWQAKKQAERALSAGTLIELRLDDKIAADKLQEALLAGLGKNTEDGYGQFALWQPMDKVELVEALPKKQLPNITLKNDVKMTAQSIISTRLLQEVRQQAANDAQSERLKIRLENAHNILKRVEGLMYSGKTKSEIQMIITMDFKSKAKENLRSIKYNGDALYDILIEADNHTQPYRGIDWTKRLKLAGCINALQELLGSSAFSLKEDDVYREYWLWFMRHAVKLSKGEEK